MYNSNTATAQKGTELLAPANLYADLSTASAATINQLRQSFQIQKLLERDARGGSRYIEIIRSHFGVISPDARLQRPEYLGGGSSPIVINPVAQTSATGLTGGSAPLGNLAAIGTVLANRHGFSQSFVEHGYVIGLVSVRADLTYQQGLRKLWSRRTRYDFYFPAFAMLGEQAVLNKEIYFDGSANDDGVFGYQALGGVSVQSFSDFWSVPLYCCWYLGWLAFGSSSMHCRCLVTHLFRIRRRCRGFWR